MLNFRQASRKVKFEVTPAKEKFEFCCYRPISYFDTGAKPINSQVEWFRGKLSNINLTVNAAHTT